MSGLAQDILNEALREADQWEEFRDSAAFSASLIPIYMVGFGPAPFLAVPMAAAAAMVLLGSRKARAARRKANDPPDRFYWVAARPEVVRIVVELRRRSPGLTLRR